MRYENQRFADERIILDGNEYIRCKFLRCHLTFSATTHPVMQYCHFDECQIGLSGAAALTFDFLSDMYRIEGFRGSVEATLQNIREGRTKPFTGLPGAPPKG